MRLHLVHNSAGKILAAADITSGDNGGPIPTAGKGQRELVIDVPAEHSGMSFLEICQSMKIDTVKKKLKPLPKKQKPVATKKR